MRSQMNETLLNRLTCATGFTVRAEVSIAIVEACLASRESSQYPLIAVIECSIVLAEFLVVRVRAGGAVIHLLLCFSAEASKGTSIVVVRVDIVVICDLISESVNRQSSIARKA